MGLPEKIQYYTYADYCEWDDDERWELIGGIPYAMTAPSTTHQRILGALHRQFANFLDKKPCEVFLAPFDVRLNAEEYDDTVVQPDLTIICDSAKIDDKGYKGVPDMVIEILSPSTAKHDILRKFNIYLRVGVREYWIVDPETRTVQVFILENGRYLAKSYGEADTVTVHALEGCEIILSDVFPDSRDENANNQ